MNDKQIADQIAAIKKFSEELIAKGPEACRQFLKDAGIMVEEKNEEKDKFQRDVDDWMLQCFGDAIAKDKKERNYRFLEEALELVQSNGASEADAYLLVDYVFGRPVGEVEQECGGVMVTLAALSTALGISMEKCGQTELNRVWGKIEIIRQKQAAKKIKSGPLP